MVKVFKRTIEEPLHECLKSNFKNEREIIVFGEYFGLNSFAGRHEDEEKKIVAFDILVGHKLRKFVNPKDFIKLMENVVEIPRVVYKGNLNEEFIKNVREDKFNTFEGVICKGTQSAGNASGGIWMCKIKTQRYLDSLKDKFKDEWQKYGE